MTRPILFAVLAAVVPLSSAWADVVCAPRADLVEKLQSTYGETRHGMGMRGPESILEIWRSESTGSWSVVMTYADGRACIVAAGDQWTPLDEALTDPA